MLAIDRKLFIFNIKEVHFSDHPFDIKSCDCVIFDFCKKKVNAETLELIRLLLK